jgi:hypothetical protein
MRCSMRVPMASSWARERSVSASVSSTLVARPVLEQGAAHPVGLLGGGQAARRAGDGSLGLEQRLAGLGDLLLDAVGQLGALGLELAERASEAERPASVPKMSVGPS